MRYQNLEKHVTFVLKVAFAKSKICLNRHSRQSFDRINLLNIILVQTQICQGGHQISGLNFRFSSFRDR